MKRSAAFHWEHNFSPYKRGRKPFGLYPLKKCKFIAVKGAQTQQPTGSQINCMDLYENYRKIDETVKMHTAAIKVYILVVFYCFRPINAILGSFDVLSSHLLRRRQGKTRLSYAARRKSSKTYLQSTPIAPKLRLSTDRRFSFLENVNLVPDIGQWPQKDEKCDKKFELSASVDTLFFGVYYRWPLLGS